MRDDDGRATGAQPRYISRSAILCLPSFGLSCCNRKSASSTSARTVPPTNACRTFTTFGFAKFYAMTAAAASDPARRAASWKLIQFMAGKPYTVAKKWALEKGLGFGQLPLLDDPDVISAWGKWVDIPTLKNQIKGARVGTWTEWTAVWAAKFRPLLASAMVGDTSVQDAMTEGADQWNALKKKMQK